MSRPPKTSAQVSTHSLYLQDRRRAFTFQIHNVWSLPKDMCWTIIRLTPCWTPISTSWSTSVLFLQNCQYYSLCFLPATGCCILHHIYELNSSLGCYTGQYGSHLGLSRNALFALFIIFFMPANKVVQLVMWSQHEATQDYIFNFMVYEIWISINIMWVN